MYLNKLKNELYLKFFAEYQTVKNVVEQIALRMMKSFQSIKGFVFIMAKTTYWPLHEILVLILYAQMPQIKAHAKESSRARSPDFGFSLSLPLLYTCVCKQRSLR